MSEEDLRKEIEETRCLSHGHHNSVIKMELQQKKEQYMMDRTDFSTRKRSESAREFVFRNMDKQGTL